MLIQGFRIRSIAVRASGAAVATDEYFNLVALLLPGNGTNGAQNNTFVDSSTNNFTVTRNGNTTQGTFSPFSQTGWSGYFDGSGDYFTLADNAALQMGASNFTIEGWFYPLNYTGTDKAIMVHRPVTTARGLVLAFSQTTGTPYILAGDSDNTSWNLSLTSSTAATLNEWNHVAFTRNSSNWNIWLNGVSVASGTASFTVDDSSTLFLFAASDGGASFPGFISNFRMIKGTAVYTSAFTPPTAPLTAISGTSLLTCQSNRFIDNSSNAFAITVAGNTSVQSFAPFDPTAAYAASTVGGSAYFDGTGDYLDIAHNTNLTFPGDFTVEFWAYPTSGSGVREWYSKGYGFQLYSNATSWGLALSANNSSSYFLNASFGTLVPDQWQHIVVTRSGNSYVGFVNGVATTLGTSASASSTGTDVLRIGDWSGGSGYPVVGYISNVRFVQGTAVYGTSNFTPPTAPVSAISNTQLLLNYTNAGITDATAKNVLETVGNAGISTTQSKWGGSAMAFDGSGDYLTFPITPLITSLGPTYTIEAWIYLANTTGVKTIYSTSIANVANYAYFIFYVNGSSLGFYTRAATGGAETGIVAGTLSANTWTHVAISVNSNSGRLYVNGIQVGSTTTINTTTFTPVYNTIGADILQGYNFNGYINDLRITPGVARYTANFTAPITAFPTQ